MTKKYELFLEIMRSETDENNALSRNDICVKIKRYSKGQINIDKKTLLNYVEKAKENIVCIGKASTTKYYYFASSSDLTMSEITFIVDSIVATKFISKKQAKQMIEKLGKLTTRQNACAYFEKVQSIEDTRKEDAELFEKINNITKAIQTSKQVFFNYYRYTPELAKVVRYETKYVMPQALIMDNGNYYLHAFIPEEDENRNFRIDRIGELEISGVDINIPDKHKLDLKKFRKTNFSMYSGEKQKIKLMCDEEKANQIFDKFGTECETHRIKKDGFEKINPKFCVDVEVEITPTFYAWLCAYGGEIKLIEPQHEVEKYKNYLRKLWKE